jgi:ethanolamine transporter EutH
MNITLFKLLVTPFFIGFATLAGRRWGAVVNGLIVGLPLTTGPISFILANQYGLEFATKAAIGNLAGQVSMCIFCLTYSLLAQKCNWLISAIVAIAAFLTTTMVLNSVTWQLFPAFVVLIVMIVLVSWSIPQHSVTRYTVAPPNWDLPARIGLATTFVIMLTTFANVLGPQLSGLISTFPIFGVIFAAFTHNQQGTQAASNLLRGIVLGSVSYAFFFLVMGLA